MSTKRVRPMQPCDTCGKSDHLAKVSVEVRVCQEEAAGLMSGRLFMKVIVVPARNVEEPPAPVPVPTEGA